MFFISFLFLLLNLPSISKLLFEFIICDTPPYVSTELFQLLSHRSFTTLSLLVSLFYNVYIFESVNS
jgi:hypothetical protein